MKIRMTQSDFDEDFLAFEERINKWIKRFEKTYKVLDIKYSCITKQDEIIHCAMIIYREFEDSKDQLDVNDIKYLLDCMTTAEYEGKKYYWYIHSVLQQILKELAHIKNLDPKPKTINN